MSSPISAVTAFGIMTAANYALAGWVDWTLAAIFVGGGLVGGLGSSACGWRYNVSAVIGQSPG